VRKKALILGAAGQDGFYLEKLLTEAGVEAFCAARERQGYLPCDVGDFDQVLSLVKALRPNYLFHLAAVSSADHSALFPNERAIVDGTMHVLEAARQFAPSCRVFIAGSALQFKNCGSAIDENSPLSFSSAYAAQRNASVFMARYFRESFRMPVFVGYFFHHDSPRRSSQHMAQKIATAAKNASLGLEAKLEVEDWNFKKEWTYAGDAMEAVWAIVSQDSHYEFVIGSGIPYSIKEWAQECFSQVGKDYQNYITSRKNGPSETITCNPALLLSCGWKARVSFSELASMMVASDLLLGSTEQSPKKI
jgi:GDPmannose 4,6-dehydratase